jgi:hypothetical protein
VSGRGRRAVYIAAGLTWPAGFLAVGAYYLITGVAAGDWLSVGLSVFLVAFGAWFFSFKWHHQRVDPGGELRMKLLKAAAKMRKGESWLNRDRHLFLTCSRQGIDTMTRLYVADEDHVNQLADEGGGAFTDVEYIMPAVLGGVLRRIGGANVSVADADSGHPDVQVLDGSNQLAARIRAMFRTLPAAYFSSLMITDAAELRDLIDVVNGAEKQGGDE